MTKTPPDALTVIPGHEVTYHNTGSVARMSVPCRSRNTGLPFMHARLIMKALNAAALDPDPEQEQRHLTADEHRIMLAALDRVTVKPNECDHGDWDWPMPRCPGCGMDTI